ncbi:MAG: SUF system NifU family Fe-S cluster assembly protein [Nitrospinae bacterium RIFCSPLOWO2_02_39_17]|nr:MAG: SUF system NifU family Fe-S cluster assembly protein [Nitrospinae bacterium RIFCSPLOWO2_02_39_17]HLA48514.1 SUF system NifU family Fe-S cluster assembly protein [Nitrospinota bacterium]
MDEELYKENILDHYKNPRNYGEIENPDISYFDTNPLCGDELQMQIKIKDGKAEDVKFKGKGCSISQASASMLTEMIKGQDMEEIKKIGKKDILDAVGLQLGPSRIKCALLSLKVLKAGAYGLKTEDEEEE